MIPASHAHVRWLVLLAAACVMAVLPGPARAQGVDYSLPPLADLTIASEYNHDGYGVQWDVTVTNSTVGAHPATLVHLVKVRITISDTARRVPTTQIWTFGNLPPGESATRTVSSLWIRGGTTDGPEKVPQRLHAEINRIRPGGIPALPVQQCHGTLGP